ncbi:MAG: UDP-N-acetylmuramoyl-L-alanine--D-glutamate ligase [Gemmatimonadetes bacterium]|nr:UDP-N-acetylmuramoyl-L-alanine--D-glutamate ligase [Gemmatimonadota bacterium]
MIEAALTRGEVAVIGLGRSGIAVARLLAREGARVYASDAGSGDVVAQAAAALRAEGISADGGRHDMARIRAASLVVVSPGVPPEALPIAAARESGVAVVGELEVALHLLRGVPYIAVTGTNGKSTVTALAAHLLAALGHRTVAAGNIGRALSDVALAGERPEWIALEVSSFQLHDTPGLRPDVGVLTNLSPDHLDRYATVEDYYADKALLYRNASAASRWVVNADDPRARELAMERSGTRWAFSRLDAFCAAHYDGARDALMLFKEPLIGRHDLPLLGWHNVENTLAAVLAVMVADAAHQSKAARAVLAAAVRSFRGLPHRLEVVADAGGVQWINDSKATNVSSARVAIESMTRPTVVLLGGKHKGEPYTALLAPLRAHAKLVIAYGEAEPLIAADLQGHVPLARCGSSFEDVMHRARAAATPGDAVLLAPACSSFDMFTNYEARGDAFRQLAQAPA